MSARLIVTGVLLGSLCAAAFAEPSPTDAAGRAASADVQSAEPAVAAPKPSTKPAKAGAAKQGGALDRLELDPTQITGNRELPKVMVIVPWKHADIGDLAGRPTNSLVDEALRPVDRDAFRRELSYYDALSQRRPAAETRVTAPARDGGAEK